ncbi:MAG: EMC3/TMCO1 family protein [Candidatus Aenigmatarchaeota archaeon]
MTLLGFEPFIEIFIISLSLGFATSLIYRVLTNPKQMKELRKTAKEYSDKMKAAQKAGNTKEHEKFMNESLAQQRKVFSMTMKPMMVSLILFWIGFQVLGAFSETVIGLPFSLPYTTWEFPYIHLTTQYTWFWWYLLIISPSSMAFRKLLGAE